MPFTILQVSMFLLIQCRLFYDSSILFLSFFFFLWKKEPNRQPIIIYSDKSANCRWKLFSRPVERNRSFREVSQFLSSCVKIKEEEKKQSSLIILPEILPENIKLFDFISTISMIWLSIFFNIFVTILSSIAQTRNLIVRSVYFNSKLRFLSVKFFQKIRISIFFFFF